MEAREDVGSPLLTGKQMDMPPARDVGELLIRHLRVGRVSVVREPCAVCGEEKSEMHHVRSVASAARGKRAGSDNHYLEIMRLANRKVVPLCKEHHLAVHRGTYDGPALRAMAGYFNAIGARVPPAQLAVVFEDKRTLE